MTDPSQQITTTVVIPTYHRLAALTRCLAGVRHQTHAADDVVVVVHCDDDPSAGLVSGLCRDWQELRCVRVGVSGLVPALNAGLAAATGSIVAFTDDDAIPTPAWLERLLEIYATDKRIAAVGGRDAIVLNGQSLRGSGQAPAVGKIQWFGRMVGNHHVGDGGARDIDVLKGVNMSYRRAAVIPYGFDDRLWGTGAQVHSEMSVCLPLRKRGLRVVYDPAIVVDHHPAPREAGDGRSGFSDDTIIAFTHNETLQILDHFGPVRRLVFLAWGLTIGTRSSPGLLVLAIHLLTRRRRAWAIFAASVHGRLAARRTRRLPRRIPEPFRQQHGQPDGGLVVDGDRGRFRVALKLAGLEGEETVIDWGCAHGWFASLIADRCPAVRVIACDIPYHDDPPKFSSASVEYHVIDERAPRLPLERDTVDRIFALDVIEHMGPGSRTAALAEMRRVLKPDGVLIVTVPHSGALACTDVENLRARFPRLHRAAFVLVRGRQQYEERYGRPDFSGPHGPTPLINFSSDSTDHHHFSEGELTAVLRAAGFSPGEPIFFGTMYLASWLLRLVLDAVKRAGARNLGPLTRLADAVDRLTSDAIPPRLLAESLGITASKTTRPQPDTTIERPASASADSRWR